LNSDTKKSCKRNENNKNNKNNSKNKRIKRKNKGTKFERELIHILWKNGFAAIRAAGSGVTSYPCPDVLASNGKIVLAFEVKARVNLPLYLTEQKVKELVMFSNLFGAKPYIALRLSRRGWRFIDVSRLIKTPKGYKVDDELFAEGCDISEVSGKSIQVRLKFVE